MGKRCVKDRKRKNVPTSEGYIPELGNGLTVLACIAHLSAMKGFEVSHQSGS
jgi:hypothetical protein